MMIEKRVAVENPDLHWEFIKCDGVVAVDLGCGRWEKVEFRDQKWRTTPEYLIHKGASHVYAYDINAKEIEWFKENVTPKMNVTPVCEGVRSVADVRRIYASRQPKMVKCDIERGEVHILELTDEEFLSVDFYAVETHTDKLFASFRDRFIKLGYKIIAVIILTHAPPMRAIFAEKTPN